MKDDSWDGEGGGSYDFRIWLSLRFKEVTDANQYFYRDDHQRFSESLQSGYAEILSVFPLPIWNFERNICMTLFALGSFYYFERGWPFGLKGPRDSAVLRSEAPFFLLLWTFWFVLWVICFCCEFLDLRCEYLGLCCELFVIVVNILVCAVSYLLLLWISSFVLWIICCCCDSCGPP